MNHSFASRKQAIAFARAARALGKVAKVYSRSGVYTQPGVGIASFVDYFVTVSV